MSKNELQKSFEIAGELRKEGKNAEVLLEEDCGAESSDVDIELLTIFEILSGEKPSGISCIKFNLKFIYFLVKKLEDRSTFEFPAANSILENTINYCELHKGFNN